MQIEDVTERLLNAQAELQTSLGFLRLELHPEYQSGLLNERQERWLRSIEMRQAACLAMLHSLLGDLGCPMFKPSQMPEGWTPA